MVSSKLAVLAASAALFESALGFNAHRHLHNKKNIDKRAMETDWVTEYVTVWVTPGEGDPLPASCTGAVTSAAAADYTSTTTTVKAAAESEAVYEAPSDAASSTVSTITSTTVIVVPTTTSTSAAAVNYDGVNEKAKTTLATSVKSQAAESEAAVQYTTTQQQAIEAVSSSVKVSTTSKAAATTTKTASKSTSSSTSSSSTYSGDTGISLKRGVAYNDGNLASTFSSSCTNCGWGYNWASSRNDLDESLTFIPTLWSTAQATDWEKNATTAINSGSKVLFSFNEPDMPNQATMTAADAAKYHVQYMNPFKDKALIAAPSVSNSGTDGQGLSYLAQWIEACEALDEQCHYDFCNIHWYSEAQYSDTLFTQIAKAKKVCGGKPIWLTEFAPTDTDADTINSFLEEVIPKLEAIDYLEGYSYFMVKTGLLMTDDSTLSTYGQTYASAST